MGKPVLVFGLFAGIILSLMLVINVSLMDTIGFDKGEVVGYTSMILAFLLIFFGVKSYRDNVAGGTIGFGRAFSVGAMIAVVASILYVATWQVVRYNFAPDFGAKYQAHMVDKARRSGEPQAEIDKKVAELQRFAEMYKNPVYNVAITFIEPLPVGLIIALISAGVLRRRQPEAIGIPDTL